jgi:hypothetical protein
MKVVKRIEFRFVSVKSKPYLHENEIEVDDFIDGFHCTRV